MNKTNDSPNPRHFFASLSAIFLMAFSISLHAAPKADYWAYWDRHDSTNQTEIDHSNWNSFLNRYISESSALSMYVLDYQKVTAVDRERLSGYLKNLQDLDPRKYNRDEQFAYWVNLYNALTVNLILKNYPVDSIKNIGSWFGLGPWNNSIATITGQKLTLNDIEHRILRPIWKDNRIHYAVNCASMGCPDLFPTAWTGKNKEPMLNRAAQRYTAQNKGVALVDDQLTLSSIYNWYSEDFGNREQLLNHLAQYAPAETTKELKDYKGDISYHYDWNLNKKP